MDGVGFEPAEWLPIHQLSSRRLRRKIEEEPANPKLIRTERGIAGKVVPGGRSAATGGKAQSHDGILAIRWKLPSGTEIDTGFRADNRAEYDRWLEEKA